MLAREVYILYKLSFLKHNSYTILVYDVFVNDEAHENPADLDTLYIVTSYEPYDMGTLLKLKESKFSET